MDYSNPLVQIGGGVSSVAVFLLIVLAIIPLRVRPVSASMPAYEESVHVVADGAGTHLEPADEEKS